jgi:hypothetical protein
MTFQQIIEISGKETIETVLRSDPRWRTFLEWYRLGMELWKDREKFLAEVPDELALAALERNTLDFVCCLTCVGDRNDQARRPDTLTAVEAYRVFGANAIAEAVERTQYDVPKTPLLGSRLCN